MTSVDLWLRGVAREVVAEADVDQCSLSVGFSPLSVLP